MKPAKSVKGEGFAFLCSSNNIYGKRWLAWVEGYFNTASSECKAFLSISGFILEMFSQRKFRYCSLGRGPSPVYETKMKRIGKLWPAILSAQI